MEILRANFSQARISTIEIFFLGGRIRAEGIPSKSCSGKLRKIHRKASATESLFNQIAGLQLTSS